MKAGTKNIAALALLVVLCAIPTVRLAKGNRELAEKLEKIRGPSEESENETFEKGGRVNRSSREMTVGRLFQQGGIEDARDFLRTYALSRQNHHHFAQWELQYQLTQMTQAELRLLRAELRKTPGFHHSQRNIEEMISNAEIALAPDDPGLFFDGVIKVARFDWQFQKKFEDWASTDPDAAIAWFQSKTSASDFHSGTIADRKNRAMVLAGLLRGIASQDLDLAVELFSKETRKNERIEGGNVLLPMATERAFEDGDEGLLRSVLEKEVTDESPFGNGRDSFWLEYTLITGDLMRSVELLRSLSNRDDFGKKMSLIISSQGAMPFGEKLSWLRKQVPEREELLQALDSPFRSQLFDGPEERYQETLEAVVAQPKGEERDIELLAVAKALRSYSKADDARRMAAEISDPDLRKRAQAKSSNDPFGFSED